MIHPVQIFKTSIPCYSDVYASRERAKYRIGRPDGSPMSCYNLSEKETITILTNLPPELVEVVKQHYKTSEDQTVTVDEGLALEEMSRDNLRQLCKDLDIKSYGKMTKEEMIAAIEEVSEGE